MGIVYSEIVGGSLKFAWTRRFSTAAVIGVIARCVTIFIRLASVPLTLAVVSPDRYGVWLIVLSVVGWLTMSDLGIPAALQNHLVRLEAEGREERRRVLVCYAIRLLSGIGATIAFTGIVCSMLFPWSRMFGIVQTEISEFRWCLIVCLLAFALGLPSRISGALFNAHGHIAWPPLVDIISQLVSFGVLLLALAQHSDSIVMLALCNLSGVVLGPLAALSTALFIFSYNPLDAVCADPEDRRALLAKGFFFFLTATGELLLLQTDAFVIAHVLGPAAVPRYLIPASLFMNFLLFQNTLLRPLWPVLTKWRVAGEVAEIRRTIAKILRWSVAAALIAGICFIVAGDWFIRLWSRDTATLPHTMAWGMAAYVLVACVDNSLATILNAFGEIEVRLYYTLVLGFVKVIVGICVLRIKGIDYLPAAYACTMLVVSLPWAARALKRTLGESAAC